jgi:hypothetical protein
MLINLPSPIHVNVLSSFLYQDDREGFTEAYIFAVTAIINRPLLFTVHTIDGAVVSRLPVHSFVAYNKLDYSPFSLVELQPWECIGTDIQAVHHTYLKDYDVKIKIQDEFIKGKYILTFDSFSNGFSEDPEQHKTFNMVELENGQYALMPNNRCLFLDRHFTDDMSSFPKYARNSTYWRLLS